MMERPVTVARIPSASPAKEEGGRGSSVEARPRGSVSGRASTHRAHRQEGGARGHGATGDREQGKKWPVTSSGAFEKFFDVVRRGILEG
jgi:hypothetical protein